MISPADLAAVENREVDRRRWPARHFLASQQAGSWMDPDQQLMATDVISVLWL